MGEAHTGRSAQRGGVSVDALVLALASFIRPLSVATVYAMLSAPRPTRLLTAYLVAGFAVSVGIGVVLAAIPEFTWELSFGIYVIIKGFKGSPILAAVDSGPVARGEAS